MSDAIPGLTAEIHARLRELQEQHSGKASQVIDDMTVDLRTLSDADLQALRVRLDNNRTVIHDRLREVVAMQRLHAAGMDGYGNAVVKVIPGGY